MEITKKETRFFGNEYVFSLITRILSIVVSIGHSIMIARYLGSELLGTNSFVNSIASLSAIVATFGIHQAYPFFKRRKGKNVFYDDYISFIVILFLTYFIVSATISFFASSVEGVAIALLIPIMGYSNVVDYICLIDKPKKENLTNLIISIIDIVLIVFLWVLVKRSFWIAILILGFTYALKAIVYSIMIKIRIKPTKEFFHLSAETLRFGFFPMIALVMTALNYKLDVMMLKQYSSITLSMIGIYSLGINIAEKLVLVSDTLKGVLISRLSKGATKEEVAKICRISFASSIALSVLIIVFGKYLIDIVYGAEYSGAYLVIVISAMGTVFIGFFKLIAQYNIVNKKQHINTLMLTVSIVVNILCNLILIPLFGINGAALATGIGHFACGLTFVIWFCFTTGTPFKSMFILQRRDFDFITRLLKGRKGTYY